MRIRIDAANSCHLEERGRERDAFYSTAFWTKEYSVNLKENSSRSISLIRFRIHIRCGFPVFGYSHQHVLSMKSKFCIRLPKSLMLN